MSEKVRIGFVGVGGMGQMAHLRNYVVVPECEVVAIAELRPKLREAVGQKYNIRKLYPSAEAMLEGEKLDAIVASQPFTHHGSIISPLYGAGIPIFTEKPIAAAEDVAEKMLAALARGGSWHMVGYHKRSDPATMYAKAEIERLATSGDIGKLQYVRITMPAGDWVTNGFRELIQTDDPAPQLPADNPDSGWDNPYIAFVNYYIHQVNLLRHLLGEPYHVTYADPGGMMLAAVSESGKTGVIELSPYQTTIDWHESALVAFERGYVRIDLPAPLAHNRPGRVEILKDPGSGVTPQTIVPTLPWNHAMYQQAVNFVRAVKGEMAPLCTAQEALLDLRNATEYMQRKGS